MPVSRPSVKLVAADLRHRRIRNKPGKPGSPGQSLVEFALILPLIFLLILNTVNFGGFFSSGSLLPTEPARAPTT